MKIIEMLSTLSRPLFIVLLFTCHCAGNIADTSSWMTTDENGMGVVPSISFSGQLSGGQVAVDVSMSYQGLTASTTTSFLIWR